MQPRKGLLVGTVPRASLGKGAAPKGTHPTPLNQAQTQLGSPGWSLWISQKGDLENGGKW